MKKGKKASGQLLARDALEDMLFKPQFHPFARSWKGKKLWKTFTVMSNSMN